MQEPSGLGDLQAIGRVVLVAGLMLTVLGVVLLVLGRLGFALRPLPGDLVVRRPGLVIYFPIVTMVVLSVIITLVLHFLATMRR